MKKENLLIVGCGQYGIFVSEIARSMNLFERIDFLDDNSSFAISKISEAEKWLNEYTCAVIAIGNSAVRAELFKRFSEIGFKLVSIISPMAYVSPTATISQGCVIEPMASVQSGVKIGVSCFISSASVIRHNAELGNFCHADCGSVVMSNSSVPSNTKINALTRFENK